MYRVCQAGSQYDRATDTKAALSVSNSSGSADQRVEKDTEYPLKLSLLAQRSVESDLSDWVCIWHVHAGLSPMTRKCSLGNLFFDCMCMLRVVTNCSVTMHQGVPMFSIPSKT